MIFKENMFWISVLWTFIDFQALSVDAALTTPTCFLIPSHHRREALDFKQLLILLGAVIQK